MLIGLLFLALCQGFTVANMILNPSFDADSYVYGTEVAITSTSFPMYWTWSSIPSNGVIDYFPESCSDPSGYPYVKIVQTTPSVYTLSQTVNFPFVGSYTVTIYMSPGCTSFSQNKLSVLIGETLIFQASPRDKRFLQSRGIFDCQTAGNLDVVLQFTQTVHDSNGILKVTGVSVTPNIPSVSPSRNPSILPTERPTQGPTVNPSGLPTEAPSTPPTETPSSSPTTSVPSTAPTEPPTIAPSDDPTASPSKTPSYEPSTMPTQKPSVVPTALPSLSPTVSPSRMPSIFPSIAPTILPTTNPSVNPTLIPTLNPTTNPTVKPTIAPTVAPSIGPSVVPTLNPTILPTINPSLVPTIVPTVIPTVIPTQLPTVKPTLDPTVMPSVGPTVLPTIKPSLLPTISPSLLPTITPSILPTVLPTISPTVGPSVAPTLLPTVKPTLSPTLLPSVTPTVVPTVRPTLSPTVLPTLTPTTQPTTQPTILPSVLPTDLPTISPTTSLPTIKPTRSPTSVGVINIMNPSFTEDPWVSGTEVAITTSTFPKYWTWSTIPTNGAIDYFPDSPCSDPDGYPLLKVTQNIPSVNTLSQMVYFPVGNFDVSIYVSPGCSFSIANKVDVLIGGIKVINVSYPNTNNILDFYTSFRNYHGIFNCFSAGNYSVAIRFTQTVNDANGVLKVTGIHAAVRTAPTTAPSYSPTHVNLLNTDFSFDPFVYNTSARITSTTFPAYWTWSSIPTNAQIDYFADLPCSDPSGYPYLKVTQTTPSIYTLSQSVNLIAGSYAVSIYVSPGCKATSKSTLTVLIGGVQVILVKATNKRFFQSHGTFDCQSAGFYAVGLKFNQSFNDANGILKVTGVSMTLTLPYTPSPTVLPTVIPTVIPSRKPTVIPTVVPTSKPIVNPTVVPTALPSVKPTVVPTCTPSIKPTCIPTVVPSILPSVLPTIRPTTSAPTQPILTQLAANIVCQITFDSTTNGGWYDSSSNHYTVTNGGGTIMTGGVNGKAAYFNGDWAKIVGITLPTAFSISFWMKPDSTNSALEPTPLSQYDSDPDVGWAFYRLSASPLTCYVWGERNHKSGQYSQVPYYCGMSVASDGQFHHVVITRSGTSITIFLDNVSVYVGTIQIPPFQANPSSVSLFLAKSYVLSNSADALWNGYLDELRIYNKVLSASEVNLLYLAHS